MSTASVPFIDPFRRTLIVIIAAIGFAFDIYELLMLPLVLRPALQELLNVRPGTPEFDNWKGLLFFVPAVAGGIFGLLGGYLTDRLGRRRVLTWSILLYAFSAYAAGLSTNMWMLLFFRTTTFIGVCVEFVAAVAWLAELFPDPKQRERILGFSQAFSSLGGLLVAIVNGWLIFERTPGQLTSAHSYMLPAIQIPDFLQGILGTIHPEQGGHAAWRYTLMSGLIPAIPLIIIRPFLPESPVWQQKKDAGQLKRPSLFAIFSPELRKTTIITTLMVACAYGAAFGAIQQLQDVVPGLSDVQAKVTEKISKIDQTTERGKGQARAEQRQIEQKVYNEYNKLQEVGGLMGRFVFAVLAMFVMSQRWLLRFFQWPGLLAVPLLFFYFLTIENKHLYTIDLRAIYLGELPLTTMSLGVMLAGFFVVGQFSFWGNYLPRVYPTHLRGTGESFAANIGGRMIGTSFAFVAAQLAKTKMFGDNAPLNYAMVAAGIAFFVFLSGTILNFFLPEPKPEMHD